MKGNRIFPKPRALRRAASLISFATLVSGCYPAGTIHVDVVTVMDADMVSSDTILTYGSRLGGDFRNYRPYVVPGTPQPQDFGNVAPLLEPGLRILKPCASGSAEGRTFSDVVDEKISDGYEVVVLIGGQQSAIDYSYLVDGSRAHAGCSPKFDLPNAIRDELDRIRKRFIGRAIVLVGTVPYFAADAAESMLNPLVDQINREITQQRDYHNLLLSEYLNFPIDFTRLDKTDEGTGVVGDNTAEQWADEVACKLVDPYGCDVPYCKVLLDTEQIPVRPLNDSCHPAH